MAGMPSPSSVENPAPSSQTPGHPSFRRQRASRACETCHSRKVRCDAASLGVPCTNCVAFSLECKIPAPKRKKAGSKPKDIEESEPSEENLLPTHTATLGHLAGYDFDGPRTAEYNANDGTSVKSEAEAKAVAHNDSPSTGNQAMKPKFARAPIREAGRVAYLGESTNLNLLVTDKYGTTDVVHYPLPEAVKGTRSGAIELDSVELEILHQRGAFLLPPRALCDELVESYFKWIAPVAPIINKTQFLARYRDGKNPPSLLLLQAVLLAGSRVCANKQLMDGNGSTTPAAMTFYKRAKALYDANYEEDRVTIVQALILMGWYWEAPEDVTTNVFYWTRVATVVAQGSGMHRSVEHSQLSKVEKRIWKRVWWTLFTRDRSTAVALGRPVQINTEDSDVEMVTEDDFIEDDGEQTGLSPDPVHVQFFLQYVRLCEIMGLVLSQQYSVASKGRRPNAIDLTSSDMALADWLQNCPKIVYWEKPRHNFWSALLHANYYTTLCLLHRAHMPPATVDEEKREMDYASDTSYPSRNIAFQAAGMISSIIEHLQKEGELRYTPAFMVYCLFSAMLLHVYQMRSSVPSVISATQERQRVCMEGLKEISKVWVVAKMIFALFESILGNRTLEDKLQKAPGRRHKKVKASGVKEDPTKKRKYDEVDAGFANGPPAPQISFERSRPQTPAATPSRELPQQDSTTASLAAPSNAGTTNDAFMGSTNSRGNTRPPTPFNPTFSIPPTPPELYLATRDPPAISQQLWENFQPNYLFPESAIPGFSSEQNVDPQLQLSGNMLQPPMTTSAQSSSPRIMQGLQGGGRWNGTFSADAYSPDDQWSTGGDSSGPIAPTTLNMDEWYQFLGINGAPT